MIEVLRLWHRNPCREFHPKLPLPDSDPASAGRSSRYPEPHSTPIHPRLASARQSKSVTEWFFRIRSRPESPTSHPVALQIGSSGRVVFLGSQYSDSVWTVRIGHSAQRVKT